MAVIAPLDDTFSRVRTVSPRIIMLIRSLEVDVRGVKDLGLNNNCDNLWNDCACLMGYICQSVLDLVN